MSMTVKFNFNFKIIYYFQNSFLTSLVIKYQQLLIYHKNINMELQ